MAAHSRTDVLEEVVDAATHFIAFLAAERIENKGAIEYLAERIEENDSAINPEVNSPQAEADQQTILTLQQAVKDHAKQCQIVEQQADELRRNFEKDRLVWEEEASRFAADVSALCQLVEDQKKEIEVLREAKAISGRGVSINETAVHVHEELDESRKTLGENEDLRDRLRKIHVHLTRAVKKFDENPDAALRSIDSSIKLAEKAAA